MYQDKTLICKDCGQEFLFTAGEQEFYESRGLTNQPGRCKACRSAKKGSQARQYHDAICSVCNGPARLPFVPKNDKPVYCSNCFTSQKF